MFAHSHSNRGFTVIELVVVVVIVGILGTLVALSYSGVKTRERDAERQTAINTLQSHLEAYYASESQYPLRAQLNNAQWRSDHIPELVPGTLRDPLWNNEVADCTKDGQPILTNKPGRDCYAYQVTGPEGAGCNNADVKCAHYTLTATFENGETYVKTSLN
jgi:prepilin-type N-terminal cleavage/methylation domain-containing protein